MIISNMPDTPTFTISVDSAGTHFLDAYWQDEADITRLETIAYGIIYEEAARLKTALETVADVRVCLSPFARLAAERSCALETTIKPRDT